MLITFEGIDLCGKTTQIEILKKRLEENGYEVVVLREPGGTKISERIRAVLLDRANLEMNPLTEFFLFSASRAQLVSEIIVPSLKSGKVVICDRFYDSSVAYQGYGRGIDIEKVKLINKIASFGLVPDLTFLIDIPVEESLKRKKAREEIDRMEIGDKNFYERVRNGYLELAESEDRFVVVDGLKTVGEIADLIWKVVSEKLNGGRK